MLLFLLNRCRWNRTKTVKFPRPLFQNRRPLNSTFQQTTLCWGFVVVAVSLLAWCLVFRCVTNRVLSPFLKHGKYPVRKVKSKNRTVHGNRLVTVLHVICHVPSNQWSVQRWRAILLTRPRPRNPRNPRKRRKRRKTLG